MSESRHPSKLNSYQQYRRSVRVAKSTSRMRNPAWYQDGLDVEHQIHCYLGDEAGARCYLHVKSSGVFEKLDGLNPRQLEQREELEKWIDSVLSHDLCRGAKSLGMIFYLADEFSLAGLGPEYKNPGELASLRDKMGYAPREVLDDKTISTETHAWRLFPYPGAAAGGEFATAVAVSRRRSETLKTIREIADEKNFPIRTCALSAPLCAIGLVPWFTKASEKGNVCLFNYHTFTLMAFFNHTGNLVVMRYMPHANGAGMPANLGPAIQATATAFEMECPDIAIVSMVGNDVGSIALMLQQSIHGSAVRTVNMLDIIHENDLPVDAPLECIAVTQVVDAEICPLAENETFKSLSDDRWHLQDFLSADQHELDMYPDRSDMKILKFGRRVRKIAALIFVTVLAYGGYNIFAKVNSVAWKHQPQDDKAETKMLTAEIARHGHWNNLLMDRSKGWVCLELVARITPTDGSVILKNFKHDVKLKKEGGGSESGFSRDWVITGYASDLGIEQLEKHCTSDGIKKLFLDVAQCTENAAYLPDVGQRDITVSLAPRFNPMYNRFNTLNAGSAFERVFTLTISQNISADDEIALSAVDSMNK